jgi:hypothetical protein
MREALLFRRFVLVHEQDNGDNNSRMGDCGDKVHMHGVLWVVQKQQKGTGPDSHHLYLSDRLKVPVAA